MKLTKDLQTKVKALFDSMADITHLYLNDKGEFFTSEPLARASVKEAKDIVKIERSVIIEFAEDTDTQEPINPDKIALVVQGISDKLTFRVSPGQDEPKVGDKARIGNKNADGVIEISEALSYKFDKGVLIEIIDNTDNTE